MRITHLATRTSVVHRLFRSPVTIGSDEHRTVCLDAVGVSELHGVFMFDRLSVEYVDLGSFSGSMIDGVSVTTQIPTPVTESSAVRVGPFEIFVHVGEALPPETPTQDSDTVRAHVARNDGSASISAILATLPQREQLKAILNQWPPNLLLARCLAVFEILGEVLVELRPEMLASLRPPLGPSATVNDIIAFLLDPSGGDEAIEAVYTQLLALLRPGTLPPISDGSS
jgi:hypothetical protein